MVQFDPTRSEFRPYGFSCVRWVPSEMKRPDRHNEIELNLLQRGSVTYFLGGNRVRIEPGRLHLFWAAIPHQVVAFEPGTEYYVATIPLAAFVNFQLPEGLIVPLLHGEMISEVEQGPDDLDRMLFASWERDLASGRDEDRKIVMLEVEARVRRLAGSLPPRAEAAERRNTPAPVLSKAEQLASLVVERYTEHLTVEEISQAVGLHPSNAMNLFRRVFGTTLVNYLTHHRISHAQRLLVTTDDKIVEVAFNAGFNSLSRFNEAFRRACGCTPRQYRTAHRPALDRTR